MDEPPVFEGHPTTTLILDGEPREFTVCAHCEQLVPVLFYAGDRWLCRECREAGADRRGDDDDRR